MSASEGASTSASEEAGLLLQALREWLEARGLNDPPIATDDAECRMCPICMAIRALRDQHPDVADQLGKAADAFMAAVRSLIVEHEHRWSGGAAGDVQRIEVQ